MKSNFQKIAVLCTCTGLLCSCGQSDNKQEHHKEFIPITILHPTTIEFPRSYVADVQAIQFVEIKPKVEGFVQQIYVDEGQKVKKGQPLFQLSSDQYSETVKEAQANYKQAPVSYTHLCLGLNVIGVDASQKFFSELAGVEEPEKKRKIIGKGFIDVFDEEAHKIKDVKWLAQGTIYPDCIESLSITGTVIKSHHNVGGLPEKMNLKLCEPLRLLFKDEVRHVGRELGMPEHLITRHPFPGPGLAVRILGDITPEKVRILQDADDIYIRCV